MPFGSATRRIVSWGACLAILTMVILPAIGSLPVAALEEPGSTLPTWAGSHATKTLNWLDSQPPGALSVVVYSLLDVPIRADAISGIDAALSDGIKNGFSSAIALENNLLCLIKLKKNPADYLNYNFISLLFTDPALPREGIDALSMALLTYQAYGGSIPDTVRNAPNSLLDSIISSQQPSGGFAPKGGQAPDAGVTARAVAALAPYGDAPYVKATIDRALRWLVGEQAEDGSFSDQVGPNGSATASVLLMAGLCEQYGFSVLFDRSTVSPIDALEGFACPQGGYSILPGGSPDIAVTELAVIAQFAATGRFPFLSPEKYPGYTPPNTETTPITASPFASYGKFLLGFGIIFFLVYCLLLLTVRIGRFAEKKKLPGSLAAQREKEEALSGNTMEMHIAMKAEMPDFDSISGQETDIGQTPPDSLPSTDANEGPRS